MSRKGRSGIDPELSRAASFVGRPLFDLALQGLRRVLLRELVVLAILPSAEDISRKGDVALVVELSKHRLELAVIEGLDDRLVVRGARSLDYLAGR